MRHRIFVETIEPSVTVTGDEFHHSVRVVRVRAGEEVELFDKTGRVAKGIVESLERDEAVIRVVEEIPSRESKLDLHLAMAIINLEKFELVLQKATELGVKSFIPLVTERIEMRRERYAGKLDRWRKIVLEAVKQSGRSLVPPIEEPAEFEEVIQRPGNRLLFDADAEPSPRPASLDAVTLLIGPEGGWSEDELEAARHHGCGFARMGPRRLRAETAAIVACAILAERYD
ncbi:MAG TPA: RsmE family RNA methyltransferase, partial [Thermoanaerobaculia bacterium]|nr:RsmE family RNA methyltransferase [Thermoanaerobaculia bacterium]